MTLHPDILTDLVILYHAGEASQASRALLEAEAERNPQIAAALSARPRALPPPLSEVPPLDERRVLRKVRTRYQAIPFAIVWALLLSLAAFSPKLLPSAVHATPLLVGALPFLFLIAMFAIAAAGLYYFVRAMR